MKWLMLSCLISTFTVFLGTNCGSDDPTYTWGMASKSLGDMYCQAGYSCIEYQASDRELGVCAEHAAWHLCVPDDTCDIEVDAALTELALEDCRAALETLDDDGCAVLTFFGVLPQECADILELNPTWENSSSSASPPV